MHGCDGVPQIGAQLNGQGNQDRSESNTRLNHPACLQSASLGQSANGYNRPVVAFTNTQMDVSLIANARFQSAASIEDAALPHTEFCDLPAWQHIPDHSAFSWFAFMLNALKLKS